jgi:hypothetical protein
MSGYETACEQGFVCQEAGYHDFIVIGLKVILINGYYNANRGVWRNLFYMSSENLNKGKKYRGKQSAA